MKRRPLTTDRTWALVAGTACAVLAAMLLQDATRGGRTIPKFAKLLPGVV
jgi:hypothetical protein